MAVVSSADSYASAHEAILAGKAGDVFPDQHCAANIGRDLADTSESIQAIE